MVWHEHVSVLQARANRNIAFSESPRQDGVVASGDLAGDVLHSRVTGRAPQNEHDSLGTCQRLVAKLRAAGESWADPETGSGDVDWQCAPERGEVRPLQIQVMRAVTEGAIWRDLARNQQLDRSISKADAVSHLRAAIEKKAERIPPSQRVSLVLALDANRFPGHAFDDVVYAFRAQHGAWLRTLAFSRTSVVGPTVALVRQLDDVEVDGTGDDQGGQP